MMRNIRFRLAVLNNAYGCVRNGSMTRDQYAKLYEALSTESRTSQLQGKILEHNRQAHLAKPLDRGGKIDWGKLLENFVKYLPIIMQFIAMFASDGQPSAPEASVESQVPDQL